MTIKCLIILTILLTVDMVVDAIRAYYYKRSYEELKELKKQMKGGEREKD